jgi:peptide/nickel transport system permease protein
VHPVTKTVLVRLGYGLLTLFLVSVVIFSAIEFLPGDFTQAILGQLATPETIAAFRKELGLDQSALSRYINWVSGVLREILAALFQDEGS